MSKVCPFSTLFRHGRRSTTTTPELQRSVQVWRRHGVVRTRPPAHALNFLPLSAAWRTCYWLDPVAKYRSKQSRKSASVDRPDRAAYANMRRHKRPLQIVHLNQARPIGLENTFGASGVFTRRSTSALRMSATGRVLQTVEKLSSDREYNLAADGTFTRNGA